MCYKCVDVIYFAGTLLPFSHHHVANEEGSYILILALGNVTTSFRFYNLVIFCFIIIFFFISFTTKSLHGLPKSGLISEIV